MASDYNITVSYKLDTGDAAGKAAEAGQRDAKAYENAFKGSVDLTQALKPGDAGRQIGEQAGASLAEAIGKSRTLVDRLRGEMLAKAFPQAAAAAAPPQFLPPPSVRGAPEDFARRMQPVVSGMEAFAMLLRGAPLLSVAQMAGQALTGLGRAAAPPRPSAPAPYRFYGMPTGEAEAIRRAEEASGAGDRIAEIQAAQRAQAGTTLGAAEAGGAGLGAGALVSRLLPLLRTVGAPLAIAGGLVGVAKAVGDIGENGADANTELHNLADTMGVSTKQYLLFQDRLAGANTDLRDFSRSITRTAVTAREQAPEIEHAIATSADTFTEANIKVRESERTLAKARDDRVLATDRARTAEGELVKVETTGAEQRQEAARAAELGVSGAQIGARGAQMRLAQAGIQAQFAQQQQQLADIAGPLTVKGAELGAKGARIAAEEARVRLHELVTGRQEDPEAKRRREIRKAMFADEVAQHNVEQADRREQEADLAERQRKRMQAAGLGPVGQARQQLLEAGQAAQQADLHVQQMATAKQRIEIDQQHNTLQMEENRAQAGVATARRGVDAAADAQTQAEIDLRKQTYAQQELQYNDVETARKMLRGEQLPEGFEPRRITAEAYKAAVFKEGAFTPGGFLDVMSKEMQRLGGVAPGADFQEQQRRFQEVFGPQRGEGVLAARTRQLARGQTPEERQRAEERIAPVAERLDATRKATEDFERERGQRRIEEEDRARMRAPEALAQAKANEEVAKEAASVTDWIKNKAVQALNFPRTVQEFGESRRAELARLDARLRGVEPEAKPEEKPEVPSIVRRRPEEIAAERAAKAVEDARRAEEGKKPALPPPAEAKPPEAAKPEPPASFAERFPALAKPEEKPTEPPASSKERFPTLPQTPVEEKPALPSAIQVKPSEAAASLDKLAASANDAAAALDKLKESAAAGGKAGAGAGGTATTGGAAAGVAIGGAAGAAGAGGDIWSQLAQTGAAQISPGGAMIRLTEQEMLRQQQMRGMVSGAAAAGAGPAAGGGAGDGDIWSRLAQTGRERISPGGAEIIYTPQELARQREMRGISSGAGGGAAATGGGGAAGSAGAGPDGWPVGIPRGGSFANVPWSSTRDFSEPVKFGPTGHVKSVGRAGSLPVYDVNTGAGTTTYDVDLKTRLPRAQQGQPGWHEQQQQAQRERERARQEEESRRQEEEERKRREEETAQEMQGADELATGGLIGGYGSGKSDSNLIRASKGEYVVTADGSNLKDAIAHFTNGFARGGLVGGFADAVAHIPGYAGGGPVTHASAGGNSLGHHSLDIRTNAGNFTAHVTEDTMEAIRKSSLGGKLSQTGPRPTWYS